MNHHTTVVNRVQCKYKLLQFSKDRLSFKKILKKFHKYIAIKNQFKDAINLNVLIIAS